MCKVTDALNKYQTILDSRKPIYLECISKIDRDDLMDYIIECSKDYYTRYIHNNNVQCAAYSNRSIGDIYRIAKYYNPSITFVDIFNTFLNSNFAILFCPTVNKIVIDPTMKVNFTIFEQLEDLLLIDSHIENTLKIKWEDLKNYYAKL